MSGASEPDGPRLGSVVIPAHQEGDRIAACLRSLAEGWRPGELDVVVVSNGSTDDTVAVARREIERLSLAVRVLDLPAPGKVGAIRAGEAVTDAPRLYLDADSRCTATTARALLRAVTPPDSADVAVPRRVLDVSGCSAPARAYHRAWQELPWVRTQLAGRGAYALSSAVRATFEEFPDVVADDRFATRLVPAERAVVVGEPVVVVPAATLREVLAVRRRVYAGNAALQSSHAVAAHDRSRAERLRDLTGLLRRPGLWPGLVLWVAVTALAKLAARRSGAVPWRAERTAAVVTAPAAPAAPTSLAVVVVTYRSAPTLEACIASLDQAAARARSAGHGVEVVVVDNGSDDGTPALLARLAADRSADTTPLTVVQRSLNDGFARGCAIGVGRSASEWVLLCNPDVVVDPEALTALVDEAAASGAAVLGGSQVRADGTPDRRSWWGAPTWWSTLCFATGLSSALPGRQWSDPEGGGPWDGGARDVGAVSGGFMLVRRAAWDRLGGLDPTFLLYGEDLDLCLRAGEAGLRVRVCGAARFRHDVGASSRAGHPRDLAAAEAVRLQLVLRGKSTALRRHLGPPAVLLLQAGVGVRSLVAPGGTDGERARTSRAAWRTAWRARGDWRRGWREEDDLREVLERARVATVGEPGQSGRLI